MIFKNKNKNWRQQNHEWECEHVVLGACYYE